MYQWLCKADNKIESPKSELSDFKKSWVAKQNLLFFSKSDTHFMVHSALPCYDILMREITNRAISIRSGLAVPIVRGAYYENNFLIR